MTATGLQLLAFGGISMSVDGREVSLSKTVSCKGMILSGVPNFGYAIGYTNASWTLKIDLVAEHFCRLLTAVNEAGAGNVVPEFVDATAPRGRCSTSPPATSCARRRLPPPGSVHPWSLNMDYAADVAMLSTGTVLDPVLRMGHAEEQAFAV